ncbi:MAG: DNA polymerase III subunit delta' [Chloroflexi bacterium]|nr:DNA polymerase III subunit delta' [Chloroflexota bacterium]
MWQTLGQDQTIRGLEHGLAAGRLAHAYLLVGPKHTGKGTLALDLAQAVNCEAGSPLPCGECRPCRRIAAGKHADVLTIRREESRTEISIDQVREVQHRASLKPTEGRWLVFILDGAEEMSAEAANCLLKTLEEPAPRALFLLLTSREARLLPTVRSRCQRLALRPMPREQMEQVLGKRGVEHQHAALVARLSRGRVGWAMLAVQESSEVWRRRSQVTERLAAIPGASFSDRFDLAAEWATHFSRRREQALEEMDLWQDWWRDLLLARSGCAGFTTNWDYSEQLQQQAQGLSLKAIADFLRDLRHTRWALEVNANPRLALETLMLHLPHFEEVA